MRDRHASPARPRLTGAFVMTGRLRKAPIRLVLLALVVIGLAPGFFVNGPAGRRSDVAVVTFTPLAARKGVEGELALTGAWEMTSAHRWFGGFSALVAGEGATLVAGTDRGFLLDIDLSRDVPRAVPGNFRFVGESKPGGDEIVDLESLARDPQTGTLWAAFEADNLVMRFTADGSRRLRAPPEMAEWRHNSGAEAMTRLDDGRILMIAEGTESTSSTAHEALLFPRDPATTGAAQRFRFVSPANYDPVDTAQLPDGRVLILLRRVEYAIPARFDTAIAIADPDTIRPGKPWRARVIQRLTAGVFADNFEGIAYLASATDPTRGAVWLIADDNFSIFQRTILVRFDWDGAAIP